MPKWVYPLSFAILVFIIAKDPDGSGRMGAQFIGFLGEVATAAGEFIGAVFGDSGGNSTQVEAGLTASETSATLPGTVVYSDPAGTLHTHE